MLVEFTGAGSVKYFKISGENLASLKQTYIVLPIVLIWVLQKADTETRI